MTPVHRNRLWLVVALLLTGLKLWLTRGQGVYAIGGAGGEDQLTIDLAQHLIRGDWLGPYQGPTLGQGPFYPWFIAAAFGVGVPLFLAQHVVYAGACGLFVRALRPAVTWPGARLAIYALLLTNPMSFDGPGMGRVIPQQVQGPLGLLIFAGLMALNLRGQEPVRRAAPWALLLGLAGGAFYLTGETVIWFVPGVLLLAGTYLFRSAKISRAAAQTAARWLGVAVVIAVLPVLAVCLKNKRHYDRFATREAAAASSGASDAGGAGGGTSFARGVDFLTSFSRFSARVPPSTGSQEELQLFRDITHERLSPPVGELDKVGAARYLLNLQKVEWLQKLGKILRPVLTTLFWLAQAGWLLRVAWLGWHRRWNFLLTLAAAAWVVCAAALVLHAMSWSAPTVTAFGAVYPLIIVFILATLWEVTAGFAATKSNPPHPGGHPS